MNSIFNNINLFYDANTYIDTKKKKYRVYRSTKPKIDKEKNKKLRKIAKKSKRINRGKK